MINYQNYRKTSKIKRRLVRVKSLNDIKRTLDKDGRCKEVYFAESMEQYCNTVQEIDVIYDEKINLVNNHYCWVSDWLVEVQLYLVV